MKREKKPRNLALKVLDGLSDKPRSPGRALDELLRRDTSLEGRDRALTHQLVQGVLRWRLRLDWIIEQASDFPLRKIHPRVLNILRLALFQIFFLDRIPESAAVNEAVNQARTGPAGHTARFVNGILRNICRNREDIPWPDRDRDPVLFLSVVHSYPRWMVARWIGEIGEEFTGALLSAQNRLPRLTIRANTMRCDREALIGILEGEGVRGEAAPFAPEGIILRGFRGRIDELPSFRQGLFQVQDEAAQVVSHLLGPGPGESVLDACAGLGGKSTHMAELTGCRVRTVSLDNNHGRLVSLVENSGRLGHSGIFPVAGDASGDLSTLFRRRFHRIMVDAPCSGLGVISRHPDGKWNRDEGDIRRLALLQGRILDRMPPLLSIGGRMLYVTCTITREECEGVVEGFIERHGEMAIEDLRDHAPQWALELIDERGLFRTFPNVHHMDGFFAALFTRK